MPRFSATTALLLLLSSASDGNARTMSRDHPSAVRAAILAATDICRHFHGTREFEAGFETLADLNRDGVTDYILDTYHLNCRGRVMGVPTVTNGECGTAGCLLIVVASTPGGYRKVSESNVQGWRLDRSGRYPTLKFRLHGTWCARAGADTCYENWGWDGNVFRELACVQGKRQPRPFPPSVVRQTDCRPWR